MATVKFFISGTKRELVPIYVRVIAGRGIDLIVKSGLTVDPKTWSNKTETIKQRIRTDEDEKLIETLSDLKKLITNEIRVYTGEFSKDWLQSIIDKFNNKKASDAITLNQYIDRYITEAKSGVKQNKDGMNFATGTIRDWEGFRLVFNDFQGIYTPERLTWRKKNKKPIRQLKPIDFNGITVDFYNRFVTFINDEGFKKSTKGRFVKDLKMFMKKSMEDGLHKNREFEYSAFHGFTGRSFSIYLTKSELDKIYSLNLSEYPELDKSRDCFMVLAETALRISDYKKVDLNIRESEDGTKLIHITQTKTKGSVVVPLSARLETILKKYNGNLPKQWDSLINRDIKVIAKMAGIDEMLNKESDKFGKEFEKPVHKWELISCHTARRSACTNMYLAGIPSIAIRQISGHKTETSFLKYIKVTAEENARILSSHPYFRNGLKAV